MQEGYIGRQLLIEYSIEYAPDFSFLVKIMICGKNHDLWTNLPKNDPKSSLKFRQQPIS